MSELYNTAYNEIQLRRNSELNNTYDARAIHKTLQTALESSYSFLNEYQKQNVKFKQFHYDTKEKDKKYTRKTMMNEYERLQKLIDATDDISLKFQYKKQQDELIVVDDGDFYIDNHHRPCFSVPFDIVGKENREAFRKSKYIKSEFTIEDISNNKNIFGYLPIIVIDSLVYFTCNFYIDHEKLFVILPYDENFIYTDDRNQEEHHTDVIFINNAYMETIHVTTDEISNGEFKIRDDMHVINRSNGIFFGFIKDEADFDSGSFLLPLKRTNDSFKFNDRQALFFNELENPLLTIVFFDRLREYFGPTGDEFIYPNDYNKYPLMLFEKDNRVPYDMPIPEENVFLLKSEDPFCLAPTTASVNRNYPNIYQINDSNHNGYLVFYFYLQTDHLRYTPIHDFYYQYLSDIKDIDEPFETYINRVYFEKVYDRFHSITRYILNLKPKSIEYSDYDFAQNRNWLSTKELYEVEKLKVFIRNDFKVIEDYAENTRRHSDIFHLFVEDINIHKRVRNSSFLDDWEGGGKSFFRNYEVCEDIEPGTLVVVPNDQENFDALSMIKIRDFGSFDEKPQIGSFVKLIGWVPMYVFMMKPIPERDLHSLRIFVDGLRIFDYETTIFLDSQYIYIPAKYIRRSSYVMIEDHHSSSFIAKEVFTAEESSKSFTIVNEFQKLYSSDLYLLDSDGYEIPTTDYQVILNNSIFEGGRLISGDQLSNVHAIMNDFKIILLNEKYFDKEIEIRLVKKFESYQITMNRRGFPRLTLHSVENCRNINHIEVYCDGRVLPENLYRIDSFYPNGVFRVQILQPIEKGSNIIIDISPYTHKVRGHIDEIDPRKVINLKDIIDKPSSINYFDFYLNGKRLGLPNVYKIEDYGAFLKNVESTHHFEIREKERDEEYFGYKCVRSSSHSYYFNTMDFLDLDFVSDDEKDKIINDIVNNQKDSRVSFEKNTDWEDKIMVENLPSLEEEYRIFYHEDLLPIGFVNPDKVQFDKTYLGGIFPAVEKDRLQKDVIFIDPDLRADSDNNDQLVLLTGESNEDAKNDAVPIDIDARDIYLTVGNKQVPLPEIIFQYIEALNKKHVEASQLVKNYKSVDNFPLIGEGKYLYYDITNNDFYYYNTDIADYVILKDLQYFDYNDAIIMSPGIS